jgi:hypothetical protein
MPGPVSRDEALPVRLHRDLPRRYSGWSLAKKRASTSAPRSTTKHQGACAGVATSTGSGLIRTAQSTPATSKAMPSSVGAGGTLPRRINA